MALLMFEVKENIIIFKKKKCLKQKNPYFVICSVYVLLLNVYYISIENY